MSKPKRIDESLVTEYHYLSVSDECYYLMEYTSRAGFAYSDANNLILNLKKGVDRKGTSEWPYKGKAIKAAADLIAALDPDWLSATLVPIPPSVVKSDESYDDRLVQVLRRADEIAESKLDIRELLYQTKSTHSSSRSDGARLSPSELGEVYRFAQPLARPRPVRIVVFDDVLTTGSHFVAAKELLERRFPGVPIRGLFLARAIHPPEENE
jgi:predicted amidophosphoribosyltransferase